MKTEWPYPPACQYHTTSPAAVAAAAAAAASRAPPSVPMIGGEDSVNAVPSMALPSPHMVPGSGGYVGLYRPAHGGPTGGQCTCPQVASHDTILHSILTGQGHKYGYAVSHPGLHDDTYHGFPVFPPFRDGLALQGIDDEQHTQRFFPQK